MSKNLIIQVQEQPKALIRNNKSYWEKYQAQDTALETIAKIMAEEDLTTEDIVDRIEEYLPLF